MFWIGAAPTVPGISDRFSSPGHPLRQRPLHEVVPVLAGTGAHVPSVGVLGDQRAAGNRHVQHETVEVAGKHEVAAAAENEEAHVAG